MKPPILVTGGLTRETARRTGERMTTPGGAPPKDPAQAREAKLAQALRANLRRRKAGSPPAPPKPPDADSA